MVDCGVAISPYRVQRILCNTTALIRYPDSDLLWGTRDMHHNGGKRLRIGHPPVVIHHCPHRVFEQLIEHIVAVCRNVGYSRPRVSGEYHVGGMPICLRADLITAMMRFTHRS